MVVFDSSTLILLAKAELLDLWLEDLQCPAAVPPAVRHECCEGQKTFDALVIQQKLDESKIEVIAVQDKKAVRKIESDFNLGKGEAEAIALALEQRARLVAVDDKNAINGCKLLGLPFATAVAILVNLGEKQLIARPEALAKLEALARHGRYKNSILRDARARLEASICPRQ